MARKKKGVVRRAIVTPDKHFPLAAIPAIKVVCKAIEIVKPDIYIDLGDVGEWHGCSHWQWKKKKRPPLEYQLPFIEQDIIDVNKGMDIIDEALDKAKCKEKHMIEGNHDDVHTLRLSQVSKDDSENVESQQSDDHDKMLVCQPSCTSQLGDTCTHVSLDLHIL